MPEDDGGLGLDQSVDAKKALIDFQGLYEKILNIPTSGRNQYQDWLAGRWREAAANWGFNTSGDLNRTARMNEAGTHQLVTPTMVYNAETGEEEEKYERQWDTDPAVTGEGFSDYLFRLKNSRDLFGGTTGTGGARTTGNRFNQISGMGGEDQRSVLDRIAAKTGLSNEELNKEAFLNSQEGRFGYSGSRVMANEMFNPAERRQFSNAQLEPDADPNASFLNTRLAALRSRYGF
tara:strand:+ start:219 stop:920 length:702 start_codon:yes stop_codon:yes gene_type:complete